MQRDAISIVLCVDEIHITVAERREITNFEYVGFCSPRQCNVTNARFDLGNFSHSSDIERREIANLDTVSHERRGRSATRRDFLIAPELLNVNGAMSTYTFQEIHFIVLGAMTSRSSYVEDRRFGDFLPSCSYPRAFS